MAVRPNGETREIVYGITRLLMADTLSRMRGDKQTAEKRNTHMKECEIGQTVAVQDGRPPTENFRNHSFELATMGLPTFPRPQRQFRPYE